VSLLKRIAALLPASWQHDLRRRHYQREIRLGRFFTDEKEYGLLDGLIGDGDWVLDIGANVGHYTMRMSELVGPTGRVIALEPVPDTFSLLAANARLFAHANVSLLNAAASDGLAIARMQIPRFTDGRTNFYEARLSADPGGLAVVTLPVDALPLPRITLAKIDVEGHELPALRGMQGLLKRDHPLLIVETSAQATTAFLDGLGYAVERLPGSSNLLCRPRGAKGS
jgi:FkbM family methyltransferase